MSKLKKSDDNYSGYSAYDLLKLMNKLVEEHLSDENVDSFVAAIKNVENKIIRTCENYKQQQSIKSRSNYM